MPSDANLFDAVCLAATQQRVLAELRKAMYAIRHERTAFESLASEPALPLAYRRAYKRMANSLRRAERSLQDAQGENIVSKEKLLWALVNLRRKAPASCELIEAIRQDIQSINAAEAQLIDRCEAAKVAMREQDKSGLIDWSMPIEYHFFALLDPGPARAFYETCDDGESMRIALGHYLEAAPEEIDPLRNWNVFQTHEGHPLQSDHHGQLVHCIIHQSLIPWKLINCIKEIEVHIDFSTVETAWTMSSVVPSDHQDALDES